MKKSGKDSGLEENEENLLYKGYGGSVKKNQFTIDASKFGNLGRFFNHKCGTAGFKGTAGCSAGEKMSVKFA